MIFSGKTHNQGLFLVIASEILFLKLVSALYQGYILEPAIPVKIDVKIWLDSQIINR